MPIIPAQCRAARALLGWSQPELAAASQVSVATINSFERGRRNPIPASLAALQNALEAAGVVFLADGAEGPPGGPGVRLAGRKGRR